MNNKKVIDNTIKLGKPYSSSDILLMSMDIFKISKSSCFRKMLFIGITIFLGIRMSKSVDTINIFNDSILIVNDAIVALFAVIFTGYSLFQALIGKNMLLYMVKEDSKTDPDMSYLQESNLYFAKVMMIQFATIILNLFIILILKALPYDWCLVSSNKTNEIFSSVLIAISFNFNFEVLWETKSFIFNVFQLFNMHAMSRVLDEDL